MSSSPHIDHSVDHAPEDAHNRWKAALNAFDITFDGRLSAGRK
jgi:hypothetical protein